MIRYIVLTVIFSAGLLSLGISDAYSKCKPVVGQSFGDILPSATCGSNLPSGGCLTGRSIGGIQGALETTFNFAAFDPVLADVIFVTGETLITNRKGDELYIIESSSVDTATGKTANLITFVGGTGVFDGASGQAVLDGTADFDNNTFSTRYRGELCTP